MNTKSQVLKLLKCSGGKFLSGQEMAEQIYVTRASIWKAIKGLEKDGYAIEAVTNKGYRLVNAIDNIDAANIKLRLDEEGFNINVKYYDEIDSTNDEARRFAQNENSDCLIIANQQTKGRGRRGRTFFSPKDSGIYMSLIVHVGKNVEKLSSITAVAAVSVAKAVDTVVYNEQNTSLIKWVNDVYIADKKVAGILTEAYSFMEDEEAGYLIIGFGINVYEPQTGFPKEIKNTAGFLLKGDGTVRGNIREDIVVEVIKNLKFYLDNKEESISVYREKSNLIGNYIKINSFKESEKNRYAFVKGISDNYHLIIEYDSGQLDELSSGEVSVVKY